MLRILTRTALLLIAGLVVALVTLEIYLWSPLRKRNLSGARGLECYGNLQLIAMGLYQYQEKYSCFPPAYLTSIGDVPTHSWRVLILEFLDPQLYERYRFSEPWNSPHNLQLSKGISYYSCPNDENDDAHTDYVAVVGDNTMFPGQTARRVRDVLYPDEVIMIVEIGQSEIHWMEPRDVKLSDLAIHDGMSAIASRDVGGPALLTVSGKTMRMRDLTLEEIKRRCIVQRIRPSQDNPTEETPPQADP